MTNRESYEAVVNGTITPDVIEHFKAALAKMDAANEKRRNTPSRKAVENAPLVEQIVNEILTNEPKTASDVAAELGVTPQKASALLRQVVAEGKATVTDVKVPKRGTQRGYLLSTEND